MGMQNINGGLGFAATLDIDDFNVSADAMERHVRNISTNIQAEAADMEQSMLSFAQKGAMYIQTYLVGTDHAPVRWNSEAPSFLVQQDMSVCTLHPFVQS